MKQAPKRALSMVLAVALVLTMFTGLVSTQAANPFKDLSTSHWAYDVIMGMYDMGFVKGDTKGNVNPEANVTTAEFMALINRVFGLYETAYVSYADTANHWANNENVFSQAAKQGYIIVENGNKIQPDAPLTREKAIALIGNYLGLESDGYSYFTDASSIDSRYRALVNAAVEMGIVDGYTDGSFKPKQYLKRSEAMKLLYYMVGGNIISTSASGVYPTYISASEIGAAITGRRVTLSNSNILKTVYISEGANNGTVNLTNDNIDKLVVRASNVVINLDGTQINEIVTDSSYGGNVTINAYDGSAVETVEAHVSTILNDTTDDKAFTKVNVVEPTTLDLTGSYPYVYIGKNARNAKITGTGAIDSIEVEAAGVKTESLPVNYNIADKLTAEFAGNTYSGKGTTAAASGFVLPYPYISSNGTTITVNYKTVEKGTVYALVYPASETEPTSATIVTYANNVNGTLTGNYYGKKVEAAANTAGVMTLSIPTGLSNAEVAVVFVPSAGTKSYSPVYGAATTGYNYYLGYKADYATGFVTNPQITAYTAPTTAANGSMTVSFSAYVAGDVYLYPYTSNTAVNYNNVIANGTKVSLTGNGSYYTGNGTVTLNRNASYSGVAAVFVPKAYTGITTKPMSLVYAQSLAKGQYLTPESLQITGFEIGYPFISYYSGTTARLTVKSQYAGTLYYAVVPTTSYPTGDMIAAMKTGEDGVCYAGNMTVKAGTVLTTGNITVPAVPTDYKIVAVLKTTSGFMTPVASTAMQQGNLLQAYEGLYASGFKSIYVSDVANQNTYGVSGIYSLSLSLIPQTAGRVYAAVVNANEYPDASEIISMVSTGAGCYARNYLDVAANTLSTITLTSSQNIAGKKVVAVLVTNNGTYVPVEGDFVKGEVLTPYSFIAPTAALTAVQNNDSTVNDQGALTITFNQIMYNRTVNSAYALNTQNAAALATLFDVYAVDPDTKVSTKIDSANYTVAATTVDKATVVTITPNVDTFVWPAGKQLKVVVSKNVLSEGKQYVQSDLADDVRGYMTVYVVSCTAKAPAYAVAMAKDVTGTYVADDKEVYFEKGTEGAVATLTLTKKNASDTLYYSLDNGTKVEYTKPVELTAANKTVEFWAENKASKCESEQVVLTAVEKPVVTLNGTTSGWEAASYATVAATVPAAGELYIGGTSGEDKLAEIAIETTDSVYLASDGKSLKTTADGSMTAASGTVVTFVADIHVNGVVVAESEPAEIKIGVISGGPHAPSIEVQGLLNDGKWANSSRLKITEPELKPSGATLVIKSTLGNQTFGATYDDPDTYYVDNVGCLQKSQPASNDYNNAPAVTITAYYEKNGKAVDGTVTEYKIPTYVNGQTTNLAIDIYNADKTAYEAWQKDFYVQITKDMSGDLPSGYVYEAVLSLDGEEVDTLTFSDITTKVYIDDKGKLCTAEPDATLTSGQIIDIQFKVVYDADKSHAIAASNTITRIASGLETVQLAAMNDDEKHPDTYWLTCTYAQLNENSITKLQENHQFIAVLSVDGTEKDAMLLSKPGTALYVNKDGKLVTEAPDETYANGEEITITVYVVTDTAAEAMCYDYPIASGFVTCKALPNVSVAINLNDLLAEKYWQKDSNITLDTENTELPAGCVIQYVMSLNEADDAVLFAGNTERFKTSKIYIAKSNGKGSYQKVATYDGNETLEIYARIVVKSSDSHELYIVAESEHKTVKALATYTEDITLSANGVDATDGVWKNTSYATIATEGELPEGYTYVATLKTKAAGETEYTDADPLAFEDKETHLYIDGDGKLCTTEPTTTLMSAQESIMQVFVAPKDALTVTIAESNEITAKAALEAAVSIEAHNLDTNGFWQRSSWICMDYNKNFTIPANCVYQYVLRVNDGAEIVVDESPVYYNQNNHVYVKKDGTGSAVEVDTFDNNEKLEFYARIVLISDKSFVLTKTDTITVYAPLKIEGTSKKLTANGLDESGKWVAASYATVNTVQEGAASIPANYQFRAFLQVPVEKNGATEWVRVSDYITFTGNDTPIYVADDGELSLEPVTKTLDTAEEFRIGVEVIPTDEMAKNIKTEDFVVPDSYASDDYNAALVLPEITLTEDKNFTDPIEFDVTLTGEIKEGYTLYANCILDKLTKTKIDLSGLGLSQDNVRTQKLYITSDGTVTATKPTDDKMPEADTAYTVEVYWVKGETSDGNTQIKSTLKKATYTYKFELPTLTLTAEKETFTNEAVALKVKIEGEQQDGYTLYAAVKESTASSYGEWYPVDISKLGATKDGVIATLYVTADTKISATKPTDDELADANHSYAVRVFWAKSVGGAIAGLKDESCEYKFELPTLTITPADKSAWTDESKLTVSYTGKAVAGYKAGVVVNFDGNTSKIRDFENGKAYFIKADAENANLGALATEVADSDLFTADKTIYVAACWYKDAEDAKTYKDVVGTYTYNYTYTTPELTITKNGEGKLWTNDSTLTVTAADDLRTTQQVLVNVVLNKGQNYAVKKTAQKVTVGEKYYIAADGTLSTTKPENVLVSDAAIYVEACIREASKNSDKVTKTYSFEVDHPELKVTVKDGTTVWTKDNMFKVSYTGTPVSNLKLRVRITVGDKKWYGDIESDTYYFIDKNGKATNASVAADAFDSDEIVKITPYWQDTAANTAKKDHYAETVTLSTLPKLTVTKTNGEGTAWVSGSFFQVNYTKTAPEGAKLMVMVKVGENKKDPVVIEKNKMYQIGKDGAIGDSVTALDATCDITVKAYWVVNGTSYEAYATSATWKYTPVVAATAPTFSVALTSGTEWTKDNSFKVTWAENSTYEQTHTPWVYVQYTTKSNPDLTAGNAANQDWEDGTGNLTTHYVTYENGTALYIWSNGTQFGLTATADKLGLPANNATAIRIKVYWRNGSEQTDTIDESTVQYFYFKVAPATGLSLTFVPGTKVMANRAAAKSLLLCSDSGGTTAYTDALPDGYSVKFKTKIDTRESEWKSLPLDTDAYASTDALNGAKKVTFYIKQDGSVTQNPTEALSVTDTERQKTVTVTAGLFKDGETTPVTTAESTITIYAVPTISIAQDSTPWIGTAGSFTVTPSAKIGSYNVPVDMRTWSSLKPESYQKEYKTTQYTLDSDGAVAATDTGTAYTSAVTQEITICSALFANGVEIEGTRQELPVTLWHMADISMPGNAAYTDGKTGAFTFTLTEALPTGYYVGLTSGLDTSTVFKYEGAYTSVPGAGSNVRSVQLIVNESGELELYTAESKPYNKNTESATVTAAIYDATGTVVSGTERSFNYSVSGAAVTLPTMTLNTAGVWKAGAKNAFTVTLSSALPEGYWVEARTSTNTATKEITFAESSLTSGEYVLAGNGVIVDEASSYYNTSGDVTITINLRKTGDTNAADSISKTICVTADGKMPELGIGSANTGDTWGDASFYITSTANTSAYTLKVWTGKLTEDGSSEYTLGTKLEQTTPNAGTGADADKYVSSTFYITDTGTTYGTSAAAAATKSGSYQINAAWFDSTGTMVADTQVTKSFTLEYEWPAITLNLPGAWANKAGTFTATTSKALPEGYRVVIQTAGTDTPDTFAVALNEGAYTTDTLTLNNAGKVAATATDATRCALTGEDTSRDFEITAFIAPYTAESNTIGEAVSGTETTQTVSVVKLGAISISSDDVWYNQAGKITITNEGSTPAGYYKSIKSTFPEASMFNSAQTVFTVYGKGDMNVWSDSRTPFTYTSGGTTTITAHWLKAKYGAGNKISGYLSVLDENNREITASKDITIKIVELPELGIELLDAAENVWSDAQGGFRITSSLKTPTGYTIRAKSGSGSWTDITLSENSGKYLSTTLYITDDGALTGEKSMASQNAAAYTITTALFDGDTQVPNTEKTQTVTLRLSTPTQIAVVCDGVIESGGGGRIWVNEAGTFTVSLDRDIPNDMKLVITAGKDDGSDPLGTLEVTGSLTEDTSESGPFPPTSYTTTEYTLDSDGKIVPATDVAEGSRYAPADTKTNLAINATLKKIDTNAEVVRMDSAQRVELVQLPTIRFANVTTESTGYSFELETMSDLPSDYVLKYSTDGGTIWTEYTNSVTVSTTGSYDVTVQAAIFKDGKQITTAVTQKFEFVVLPTISFTDVKTESESYSFKLSVDGEIPSGYTIKTYRENFGTPAEYVLNSTVTITCKSGYTHFQKAAYYGPDGKRIDTTIVTETIRYYPTLTINGSITDGTATYTISIPEGTALAQNHGVAILIGSSTVPKYNTELTTATTTKELTIQNVGKSITITAYIYYNDSNGNPIGVENTRTSKTITASNDG